MKASSTVKQTLLSLNSTTNDFVKNIEAVQTSAAGQHFYQLTSTRVYNFISASKMADTKQIFFGELGMNFYALFNVVLAAVLATGRGSSAVANFAFFMLLSNLIMGKTQLIHQLWMAVIRAFPSFNSMADVLTLRKWPGTELKESVSTIHFDHMSFQYKDTDSLVISDLSATFKTGDIVHVSGSNGSGKSTLIKLISGLLEPTEGKILFDEKSTTEISRSSLRQLVDVYSQDVVLLNGNVGDHIRAVTGQVHDDKTIDDALRRVESLPATHLIQDSGLNLSVGQRKRLLMGMLLAVGHAPITILDEVDSGLDLRSQNTFDHLVEGLSKRGIVFVISHRDHAPWMIPAKQLRLLSRQGDTKSDTES